MTRKLLLLTVVIVLMTSMPRTAAAQVRLGSDVLAADSAQLVRQRRVGVVCNSSSRLSDGRHVLEALTDAGSRIVAVFTPEHGFDLHASAGESVPSGTLDELPVYSLYGAQRKPRGNQLAQLDLLVFDLQDSGARWYTYVSTLALCLEAAAEAHVPVMVLDRPNPLGGERMEGPVREDSLRSFVGMLPVPVRHAMTIGELALMMAGEHWIDLRAPVDLRVLRMDGWRRSMYWEDTGITWHSPSPNMSDPLTALVYAGTCLLEASNVSEGRGTDAPFLQLGAPFVAARNLAQRCNDIALPAVRFEETRFTPEARPGAVHPSFATIPCEGVRIVITDVKRFDSFRTGLEIIRALLDLYGGKVTLGSYFDLLAGVSWLRPALIDGQSPARLEVRWKDDLNIFAKRREAYLLYR